MAWPHSFKKNPGPFTERYFASRKYREASSSISGVLQIKAVVTNPALNRNNDGSDQETMIGIAMLPGGATE